MRVILETELCSCTVAANSSQGVWSYARWHDVLVFLFLIKISKGRYLMDDRKQASCFSVWRNKQNNKNKKIQMSFLTAQCQRESSNFCRNIPSLLSDETETGVCSVTAAGEAMALRCSVSLRTEESIRHLGDGRVTQSSVEWCPS